MRVCHVVVYAFIKCEFSSESLLEAICVSFVWADCMSNCTGSNWIQLMTQLFMVLSNATQ